ncbi:MAG TPA: chemotaxis protein CheX [Pseudogracilibacillus sp.]|nr:chemotaxis protein CheX [Pseudogracilibacillus sp.]
MVTTDIRNKSITSLLNGTSKALQTVVPLENSLSKPSLDNGIILVQYGVFIGITGDIKGKLILIGEEELFGSLGKVMFGTEIDGEMLLSFSGELGNMIAGNLSTHVVSDGLNIDITAPSIIKGSAEIQGHNLGIQVVSSFKDLGDMKIHLLLDE